MKSPTNMAASVRTRLMTLATARNEPYQYLLTRYANERFLARLAVSSHASRFVLKGASLFVIWTGNPHRATKDIDLLGFGDQSEAAIHAVFTELLTLETTDDGVTFEATSLTVAPIRDSQEYGGLRARFVARIGSAKLALQVDIGVGDAVTPDAALADFPALLDFPAPRLRSYPRETVVSEKVEAMVKLDLANTRMKDFYDVALLAQLFDFDGEILVQALRATFDRRNTVIPTQAPRALTPEFTEDPRKTEQWTGFLRKSGVQTKTTLAACALSVEAFIAQPLSAAAAREAFAPQWRRGGPWA